MINARMAKRVRDRGLVPVLDGSEYVTRELQTLCLRVKSLLDELNEVDIRIGELAQQEDMDRSMSQ